MNILVNYIDRLNNFLPKNILKFLGVYFLGILLLFVIPLEVFESFYNLETYSKEIISDFENTRTKLFLITVILTPLIETLIIQILLIREIYLILEAKPFKKEVYDKRTLLISIILSSLIFWGLHFYSFLYIILMCVLGFIFGLVYYFSATRNWRPFFPIFILHALYNLTVLFLDGAI